MLKEWNSPISIRNPKINDFMFSTAAVPALFTAPSFLSAKNLNLFLSEHSKPSNITHKTRQNGWGLGRQ